MKYFRVFYCIAVLVAAMFLVSGTAQAALLAYFPFENNSPDDVVHSLTATVNGAPTYVTDSPFGDAISFDGVDDYLDVVDDPQNDVLEAIDDVAPDVWGTVMMWVRTADTSEVNGYTGPTFFERRVPGSTFGFLYHMGLSEDGYLVNVNMWPQHSTIARIQYAGCPEAPVINDGQWHHIATTIKRSADETTSYLYVFVDGYQHNVFELGADSVLSNWTACEDLHIGAREKNTGVGDSFADADIDELAIYDEWMSGAEIREIMANGVLSDTPIPGDTNDDDIVDETDATTVAGNWGNTTTEGPSAGDFNNDGVVNATDASIMAANWGNHTGDAGGGAVPEPSVLVLLFGSLLLLLARRRG